MSQAATPGSPGLSGGSATGLAPLSESRDLYGDRWLKILTDALTRDQADWYRHDPSTVSWLIGELGAAHRFIREQVRNGTLGVLFGPEQYRTIDGMVTRRDFAQLTRFRDGVIINLVMTRNGCGTPFDANAYWSNRKAASGSQTYRESVDKYVNQFVRVTDVLTYALMVQSVLVDRQLKDDIAVTAERKGCDCADLNLVSFYDVFPSDEAKAAFNAYVQCKWPLHVFAVDPVIEQQNQLDLYSARSELQVALAVALASGKLNFDQATKYARRLETDLETVALNRTAVGFGAGETTFGWRFYPRIQSPPTQSNPRRIADLLLFNGPGPNYIAKNRMIEPGLRECIALVVTPNFVPAVHLTTIANWFGIAGAHAPQKFDTPDFLEFSRKLQRARGAIGRVCDADQYRPGELARLAKRLDQLEAQLPTQDYRVTLPDEGDLAGSEIFSSNAAKLAPRLLTWYGEPAKVGATGAIFLLGTGFSVHETKAIAGGVDVAFNLISRNVIQLTLPADARPIMTNDGRIIFDVHLATPNGISNHLFVEALPADEVKPPTPAGYTLTTPTLTIPYTLQLTPGGGTQSVLIDNPDEGRLRITWNNPNGAVIQPVDVGFTFPLGAGTTLTVPAVPASGGVIDITGDALVRLAAELLDRLNSAGSGAGAGPLKDLATSAITIVPKNPNPATVDVQKVPVAGQLTAKFLLTVTPQPEVSGEVDVTYHLEGGKPVVSDLPAGAQLVIAWPGAGSIGSIDATFIHTVSGADRDARATAIATSNDSFSIAGDQLRVLVRQLAQNVTADLIAEPIGVTVTTSQVILRPQNGKTIQPPRVPAQGQIKIDFERVAAPVGAAPPPAPPAGAHRPVPPTASVAGGLMPLNASSRILDATRTSPGKRGAARADTARREVVTTAPRP